EYFHVWNMSVLFVQNLSSLFVQILSRFFSCLEYVQDLSGFLDMKNSRRSFFRTFSRHFLDMKKILDNFWTILMTFSGYFFFIGTLDFLLVLELPDLSK